MTISKNTHFEYVFHFLFRTYLWVDNCRLDEPPLGLEPDKRQVLEQGICFEDDKRLFRRDVPRGAPLSKWGEHLGQSWQEICQIYAEAFGDAEQARYYCQNALQGVALFILEDGNSLKKHTVAVPVKDKAVSTLNFVQSDNEAIFQVRIAGFDKVATAHRLNAVTLENKPFFGHLAVRLGENLPYLTPLDDHEAAPNSAFLVYGFTFGDNTPEWQESVESILIGRGLSENPSLLSTVFTRLIMGQWQFMRIDKAANNVRALLQERNTYYADYANQSDEVRPLCAHTRLLERQLQEMHSLNTQARFAISRLQGASRTLDINGYNLATRLENIRQEAGQIHGTLQLHPRSKVHEIHWSASSQEQIALLAIFQLSMKQLQDHQVYIQQQAEYLDALRDKWRLYLDKRKTQMGEYLNTLGTIFIFLVAGTTGAVTLNVNKGMLGLNFENQVIYLALMTLLLIPILWYFIKWVAKLVCCIFHGTWFNRLFCQPVFKWVQSVEFFGWFKSQS